MYLFVLTVGTHFFINKNKDKLQVFHDTKFTSSNIAIVDFASNIMEKGGEKTVIILTHYG